ncbi:hypothetical protein Ngar_c01130 [Candidatus Nitrososphaera gargensis Ga9.2]|uniref:Uncharacterized protein n=1 Tax=Nitrososphaera gargensis (strain Ga9.2) TaxID=1237085 RepID=K0IE17_NITGG|nr:hypothetical protein Ngar_c01130 [Candidatus Nitrososphaera gargensis Ga9.2]
MPFFKLMQYVTYKASWESVPVLTTKEWYSPKFATDAAVIIRQGHIRACSCAMPVVTLATPITMEQLILEIGCGTICSTTARLGSMRQSGTTFWIPQVRSMIKDLTELNTKVAINRFINLQIYDLPDFLNGKN